MSKCKICNKAELIQVLKNKIQISTWELRRIKRVRLKRTLSYTDTWDECNLVHYFIDEPFFLEIYLH